ncbi:hypothetical protein F2Q69_00013546 [Brassica cretica]|uniref:Uncharacterized protein n=1 Tax=Brassica cretica TaxID=69181 RepID=A0A8S9QR80_BRACR|nr:hypothetical protein F2Q69_00013546 [Brassica cretica]
MHRALKIGVIGSRWCDGSRDDIKALVSCCVCSVLSSKTLHHIFIISIMLAISVAGMVLPMPPQEREDNKRFNHPTTIGTDPQRCYPGASQATGDVMTWWRSLIFTIGSMAEEWLCGRILDRFKGLKPSNHLSLDRSNFQESVAANGIEIGVVQKTLLALLLEVLPQSSFAPSLKNRRPFIVFSDFLQILWPHPTIPYLLFTRLIGAEVSSCTLESGQWLSGAESSGGVRRLSRSTPYPSDKRLRVVTIGTYPIELGSTGQRWSETQNSLELGVTIWVLANVQQMDDVTFCQIAQVFSSFVRRLFVRGYVTFCHHLTLRHHSTNVLVILGRVEFILDLAEFEYKYYNVILGMDWLSWYRVVLICPRARAHIPGAKMSFYCPLVAC